MDKEQTLEWHSVAKIGDMRKDEPKPVRIGDRVNALYHINGKIYATNDVCTHEFAMLSEGFIEGEEIECPLHQARFHIPTGQVRAAPATEDIPTFPVRVEGEDIMIGVPTE